MQTSYITSAAKAHQLPAYTAPEAAFIGRSNCGKSSLLNALVGRKNLARASATPGRTQMVNFFAVGNDQLIFADLPGYGFNSTPHKVRQFWNELVETYTQRPNICTFLFLMDCRREFEEYELDYLLELSRKRPVAVVLTKIDKVGRNELNGIKERVKRITAEEGIELAGIFPVSSLKKTGVEELRQKLLNLAQSEAAHLAQGEEAAQLAQSEATQSLPGA